MSGHETNGPLRRAVLHSDGDSLLANLLGTSRVFECAGYRMIVGCDRGS